MFKEKCKSTSGASIFIALLFLLMCGLAGSVVLTAASTSAGSLRYLKKNEQSYYTVLSAARLLKEEIQGEKYSRYQFFSEEENKLVDDYNEWPRKAMADFLKVAADSIFESKIDSVESKFYSDTWIITTSESAIKPVTVEFYMDTKYNITIRCSQGNKSCTLKIPAVVSKEQLEEIKETTLIWTEGQIQK